MIRTVETHELMISPAVSEQMAKARLRTEVSMPEHVEDRLIAFLSSAAMKWLKSDEGKAEIKRRNINKLHRQEYAKTKNGGSI